MASVNRGRRKTTFISHHTNNTPVCTYREANRRIWNLNHVPSGEHSPQASDSPLPNSHLAFSLGSSAALARRSDDAGERSARVEDLRGGRLADAAQVVKLLFRIEH